MENLLPLIVQLVSGAAGGKLLGMLGIGAATAAGADAGGMDLMDVLSSVAGGGVLSA